ncbi:methyl-accepting chemotaxis protein [Simiduia sp. 21SJ11W-1]|uniref:methyl-accepting chemotaxis protein n=1 Tax=Simiduia sp. 21SJ11W-1 TaxID=2909669 RepID=UPI00209E31FF|nr:methyl-accepting chemotaxis protein [Simiduia sp. 21SJ11W-1]UTA47123.1 methyl-accepting chemotaxis protein [Simiduia sp. 21SJ11W-1]
MNLFVYELPEIAEITGKLRGRGAGVAAKGSFTPEIFIEVSGYVERLSQMQQKIKGAKEALIATDKTLSQTLDGPANNTLSALEKFVELTDAQLLKPAIPTISAADYFALGTSVITAQGELYEQVFQLFTERARYARNNAATQQFMVLTIYAALTLCALYLLISFQLNTRASIKSILDAAHSLRDGKLNVLLKPSSSDELSEAIHGLNDAMQSLQKQVKAIANESTLLNNTAESLDKVSQATRQSGDSQQQQIARVLTDVGHSSESAQSVLRLCEDAALRAKQAVGASENCSASSLLSADASRELATNITAAAGEISELSNRVQDISSVIDAIRGIAEQTNLLALNAAIEAARAGEQGRGFAVVADEVRTLASRTQEATQEIHKSIQSLQAGAANAVSVMEQSSSQAGKSEEQTRKTGKELDEVTTAIKAMAAVIGQVAAAAKEQATTASNIENAVGQVSHASAELVNGAEQVAENAKSVFARSRELDQVVAGFEV